MVCLYIAEAGAKIRRTGRRLLVERDDKLILEIPTHRLDRLLLYGRTQLTADALALLLDRNIEVSLLTRRGRFRGTLVCGQDKGVTLRHQQHLRSEDQDYCLAFARTLVHAKILSARAVLRRYAANHTEVELLAEAHELTSIAQQALEANRMDSLRGYEGTAARHYFAALGKILHNGPFAFTGRYRRPPPDPVNAMLSLGYVVFNGFLAAHLLAMGFEAHLGFYHSNSRNEPALALDLLEEFRHPLVDRFVLWVIHKQVIRQEHFIKTSGRVSLTADGRRLFFQHWEEWIHTKQRLERSTGKLSPFELVHRQAERLAGALLKNESYTPFSLET